MESNVPTNPAPVIAMFFFESVMNVGQPVFLNPCCKLAKKVNQRNMFTGIVEAMGEVLEIIPDASNKHFRIQSPIGHELKVDQSISHNGVCLTVTRLDGKSHWVTAIHETLLKSNLGSLEPKSMINLERCMKADGRFDGHIVQGHVDQTAKVESIIDSAGSFVIRFSFQPTPTALIVEKGSICVNGVSLTCFNVSANSFEVAIIPYTWQNTTFGRLKVGDIVNLEFDVIGKYVSAMLARR
jgi:riboflavin synthase